VLWRIQGEGRGACPPKQGCCKRSTAVSVCRFDERHNAVITVRDLLPYIMVSLDAMQSWKIQTTGHEARTLLNSILKADFLVGLICLREVSAMLRPVSLSLQRENVDLVQALITDTEDLITLCCNDGALKLNMSLGLVSFL